MGLKSHNDRREQVRHERSSSDHPSGGRRRPAIVPRRWPPHVEAHDRRHERRVLPVRRRHVAGQDHPAPSTPRSRRDDLRPRGRARRLRRRCKRVDVGPGGMSFVPRGVPHALLVVSEQAQLLTLQNPGSARRSTAARVSRRPATRPTRSTSLASKRRRRRTAESSSSGHLRSRTSKPADPPLSRRSRDRRSALKANAVLGPVGKVVVRRVLPRGSMRALRCAGAGGASVSSATTARLAGCACGFPCSRGSRAHLEALPTRRDPGGGTAPGG